jgi:sRNA-binding regulator protein Hfq
MKIICQYIILIAIVFGGGFHSQAQNKRMEEVVYLKNGSVIRGVVTEMSENVVKIETIGRNLFVFNTSEVEKVVKEKKIVSYLYKERGFFNVTEFGRLPSGSRPKYGYNERSGMELGFHTINGYKINRWIGAGLGVGIQNFNDLTTMPVFLSLQSGDLVPSKVTPYFFLNTGNGFALNETANGGFMFNPGAGIKINGQHTGILMSVGYHMQKASIDYFSWGGTRMQQDVTYNRISLRIGVTF